MLHFLVLGGSLIGLLYLSSRTQVKDSKISNDLKLDTSKQGSAIVRKAGYKDTDNNLAYFNTPLPRHRANSVTFYEAETMENKNEIHDEILQARKSGNAIKQVETLARFHRSKDNALQNLAVDYNNQNTLVKIRRNTGIPSSKRIMETVADHPKLQGVEGWVPHMKSCPIPVSMTRSYWRPTAYMKPAGYLPV